MGLVYIKTNSVGNRKEKAMEDFKFYKITGEYINYVVGVCGYIPEGATHVQISEEPIGEWKNYSTLRKRDCLRKWKNLSTGEISEEVDKNLYVEATIDSDICLYCGYDNGKRGEERHGYDCGYCGSN